jgi:EAL domain-containing protein (putative c-di-GMP-specific phosphodiesterase class I)
VRGCANPKVRALVEGLLSLARRVGIQAVLEGVEEREDLVLAATLGVELVQGHLFRERYRSVEVQDLCSIRGRQTVAIPG